MFKSCEHKWEEVQRKFNPSRISGRFRAESGYDPDDFNKVIFGFTNIEQHCTECGKIDVQQFVGEV